MWLRYLLLPATGKINAEVLGWIIIWEGGTRIMRENCILPQSQSTGSSISNERSAFLSTSTWWWQDFPFFVSTVLMCLLQSPLRKFNSNYYARVVISELMLNDAKPNLFDFPLPTFHAPPRLWNVLLEDFVLVILFWQVMNKTHRAVQFERWKRFHS